MSLKQCSLPENLKHFDFKNNGSFDYVKHLGEGSFGVVYLVSPSQTNPNYLNQAKHYAVKISHRFIVKREQQANENMTQETDESSSAPKPPKEMNFVELREICNMKQLDQINIVKLIECKIDKKENFTAILMEYVETNVSKFYKDNLGNPNVMNEAFFKNIVRQFLNGLEYMHSKNLIHRDLKTDNLLFDSHSNTLKISDFGFSRKLTFDKKAYTDVGTLCYKPPEVILGNMCYGASFDVWSAGVIIIELLIGNVPFQGERIKILSDIAKYLGPIDTETEKNIVQFIGISTFLGPIDDTTMKGSSTLKNFNLMHLNGNLTTERVDFKEYLKKERKIIDMDFEKFYAFIKGFLVLDPIKRITIKDALMHQWLCR